jgi:hypothetical protein
MNDARKLYLATYGAIDTMDHLIKNCDMKYHSWKYWHAAMLLAKMMAIVVQGSCRGNLESGLESQKACFLFRISQRTCAINAAVHADCTKLSRQWFCRRFNPTTFQSPI